MAIDLSKYGITGTTEIVHNPSYEHAVRGGDQARVWKAMKRARSASWAP